MSSKAWRTIKTGTSHSQHLLVCTWAVIHSSCRQVSTCHASLQVITPPSPPTPLSVFFGDLQQMQACDSRRELIALMGLWINGVWGWGKIVTWEFWGVLLPQDQYCQCHKYLCHPGPWNTYHFSFFPPSLLIAEALTNLTTPHQTKFLMDFSPWEGAVSRKVDCFR